MIPSESHTLFRRLCDESDRVVVTTHMNPDGDAIGSQIGMARFLLSLGKQVQLINGDPTPEILAFLDTDPVRIQVYEAGGHDADLDAADLVVLVDNSAPDRLGRMEAAMARCASKTLCIDHHPTRDVPWAHNIVLVESCAAAALVYELVREYGWPLDLPTAEAIYVGLATDTGFFRFNSTTAGAHDVAADLLRLGVDPGLTYRRIYERNSEAYTRLLGHALAGLRLDAGGAVVSAEVPRTLIDSLDADGVDTSEVTTALLAMDGVRVAILFRELPGGRVKVSLRSKGDIDVHQLATEFGGGGHHNASGIVMVASMRDVVRKVTSRASALAAETPF